MILVQRIGTFTAVTAAPMVLMFLRVLRTMRPATVLALGVSWQYSKYCGAKYGVQCTHLALNTTARRGDCNASREW